MKKIIQLLMLALALVSCKSETETITNSVAKLDILNANLFYSFFLIIFI